MQYNALDLDNPAAFQSEQRQISRALIAVAMFFSLHFPRKLSQSFPGQISMARPQSRKEQILEVHKHSK